MGDRLDAIACSVVQFPRGKRVITPEGHAGTVVSLGADDGRLVRIEVWYEPDDLRETT